MNCRQLLGRSEEILQPLPAATCEHSSHARFLSSGMPITVQHVVHEPQDLPGAMGGLTSAFQSSPKFTSAAESGAPARSALLRFASPILKIPIVEGRLSLTPSREDDF